VVLSFKEAPMYSSAANLYIATDGQGVWVSNNLLTWTNTFSAAYENVNLILSLYMSPDGATFVLTAVGQRWDELFTSTDGANSWNRVENLQSNNLHRTFPVGPSTFLNIQTDLWRGTQWFFKSNDRGVTFSNTSAQAPSVELVWLQNSKSVLHIGPYNVTTASIQNLTSWTTQYMNVSSNAQFLVFQDSFYGIENNKVWSSPDGLSWTTSFSPYYVNVAHDFAVGETSIFGVGSYGISVSAK
jgi:hypothetical protein